MTNHQEPKLQDAVLGGDNPPPVDGAILGGLEGAKRRLASGSDEVRIAALSEALKYGKKGKELIMQIVLTETGDMQWAAWDLLWDRGDSREKMALRDYSPFPLAIGGVDCARLRDFLAAQRWRSADWETGRLFLKVAGQEKRGFLTVDDINKFPGENLEIIDRLWVKYSKGRFGFWVQKQLYEKYAKPHAYKYLSPGALKMWDIFRDRVGWDWHKIAGRLSRGVQKKKPPLGCFPLQNFLLGGYDRSKAWGGRQRYRVTMLEAIENNLDSIASEGWLNDLQSRFGDLKAEGLDEEDLLYDDFTAHKPLIIREWYRHFIGVVNKIQNT